MLLEDVVSLLALCSQQLSPPPSPKESIQTGNDPTVIAVCIWVSVLHEAIAKFVCFTVHLWSALLQW